MQKTHLKNRLIGNCRGRTPNASEWANCFHTGSSQLLRSSITHHACANRIYNPFAHSSHVTPSPFAQPLHPTRLSTHSPNAFTQACLSAHLDLFAPAKSEPVHRDYLHHLSYHVTIHAKIYTVGILHWNLAPNL